MTTSGIKENLFQVKNYYFNNQLNNIDSIFSSYIQQFEYNSIDNHEKYRKKFSVLAQKRFDFKRNKTIQLKINERFIKSALEWLKKNLVLRRGKTHKLDLNLVFSAYRLSNEFISNKNKINTVKNPVS